MTELHTWKCWKWWSSKMARLTPVLLMNVLVWWSLHSYIAHSYAIPPSERWLVHVGPALGHCDPRRLIRSSQLYLLLSYYTCRNGQRQLWKVFSTSSVCCYLLNYPCSEVCSDLKLQFCAEVSWEFLTNLLAVTQHYTHWWSVPGVMRWWWPPSDHSGVTGHWSHWHYTDTREICDILSVTHSEHQLSLELFTSFVLLIIVRFKFLGRSWEISF